MRAVFIGDEVTAAGYRLAGLEVRTPPVAEARAALTEAAAARPPLILATMEYLGQLEEEERLALLAGIVPPVLPVADAGGRVPVDDLAGWIRAGILT